MSHFQVHNYTNYKNFNKLRHLTDENHVHYLSWIHTRVTQIILCMIFSMCSNHTMFKLQRARIQNTQLAVYIFDTPMNLKQHQGHQTDKDNVDPKQGYNHAKFKDLALMVSEKKPTLIFFSNKEIQWLPSWTCVKIKNSGIIMVYLM